MPNDNKQSEKADVNTVDNQSLFLSNLEQWIDRVISQDGLTDKQVAMKIRDGFRRSIQANIEHHSFLAKNTDDKGSQDRHLLMAQIYEELLG